MADRSLEQPSPMNRAPNSALVSGNLPALEQICAAPDDVLDSLDVAAINLTCAMGLPGAEHLNFDKMFNWLDEAARRVDYETRRHWYRFVDSPASFNNSPGYFCCYFLLQVLQQDCGVRYNPNRAVDPTWQDRDRQPDFRDSRDLFLHGMIAGDGGTCGSMPVMYAAVGRRLGYPLKLVETRAHLFVRWEDPSGVRFGVPERFNVEGSGHGITSFPDDYYRTWPEPWTADETKANCYLRSLTAREELAGFLVTRGSCLEDNGRFDEAIQAYRRACELTPNDPRKRGTLSRLIWRMQRNVLELTETITISRLTRELARFPSGSGSASHLPTVALHNEHCRCWNCQQARLASEPKIVTRHHPHCDCRDCTENRTPMAQAVGHVAGCECSRCREKQEIAGQRPKGHIPGCGCMSCNRMRNPRRAQ